MTECSAAISCTCAVRRTSSGPLSAAIARPHAAVSADRRQWHGYARSPHRDHAVGFLDPPLYPARGRIMRLFFGTGDPRHRCRSLAGDRLWQGGVRSLRSRSKGRLAPGRLPRRQGGGDRQLVLRKGTDHAAILFVPGSSQKVSAPARSASVAGRGLHATAPPGRSNARCRHRRAFRPEHRPPAAQSPLRSSTGTARVCRRCRV